MVQMLLSDGRDLGALAFFLIGWVAYTWVVDHSPVSRHGLGARMNRQRAAWMRTLMRRELRMIDTAILAGLQQGTAFFASACIFAIGGCFALLGAADTIGSVVADLPLDGARSRELIEGKLIGLVAIFAYAFFKFGWAYRLFNYCSILIGAIPMRDDAQERPDVAERALARAAEMNLIAGRQFNTGLRAVFFGIAYLGWFIGPLPLFVTTSFVTAILLQRQFLSAARHAVTDEPPAGKSPK